MSRDASTGSGRRRLRRPLAILGLLAAGLFVLVFQQVLGITQRPSWPPPPGAVTSVGAEAATEAFAARAGTRPHDAARSSLARRRPSHRRAATGFYMCLTISFAKPEQETRVAPSGDVSPSRM